MSTTGGLPKAGRSSCFWRNIMGKIIDLTGQRYGRFIALKRAGASLV